MACNVAADQFWTALKGTVKGTKMEHNTLTLGKCMHDVQCLLKRSAEFKKLNVKK